MDFILEHGKEIVALLVPFITWYLNVALKGKSKLVWTSRHAFTFLVQEPLHDAQGKVISPTQTVHTNSIQVINSGKQSATKIEIVFNWKPQYLNIWPIRDYETKTTDDKRHILIFENLSPKEEIGFELLSINTDLPSVLTIRSSECVAEKVLISWAQVVPRWRVKLAIGLMFVGMGAAIYLLIVLLQILMLKTPIAI